MKFWQLLIFAVGKSQKSNVEVICTTDDPADDLHYHQLLAHEEPDLKVLPSFRPDKALNIEKEGFNAWVTLLEEAADQTITTYQELIEVLGQRIEYFHQHGCRVSDHALDILRYKEADETVLEEIFQKHELTNYYLQMKSMLIVQKH